MCTVCTDWQDRNRPGAGAASSPAAGTGVEGSPEPAGTVVSHGPQPYVLLPSNSHWPDRHGRTITWWNSARDLNPTYLWETRQAFAAWAAVANVNFVQAGNGAIPIRFGDSGDDNDLGRPGGTLGITNIEWNRPCVIRTFFGCIRSGASRRTSTRILMDRAENWNAIGFYNVMLHEIGHALGLAHTSENPNETDPIKRNAVMFSRQQSGWTTRRLNLTADDINGIRALFGTRQMTSFADMNGLGTARGFQSSVHGTNDRNDYFRFTLIRSTKVWIRLSRLSADADLYLLNSSGTLIRFSRFGATKEDSIEKELLAGDYIIRVDAYTRATINYSLWLYNLNGTSLANAYSLGDLGGLPVGLERTFDDSVSQAINSSDYFSFTLRRATRLQFALRNLVTTDLIAGADLLLLDSLGRTIASSARSSGDLVVRWLGPGTYYVRVSASGGGGSIGYSLRYSRADGLPTAGISWLGDLTSVVSVRTSAGTVVRPSSDDFYRFALTQASRMRFELRNLSADANLYLMDSNGREIASSTLAGSSVDSIVRALDPGTYFVHVDANASGTVNYELRYENQDVGRTRERAVPLGNLTGQADTGVSRGTVTPGGTNDRHFYRFSLRETRSVRIQLGQSSGAGIGLLDASGTVLESLDFNSTSGNAIIRELGSGTYYIRVVAEHPNIISDYELRYRTGVRGTVRWAPYHLGELTGQTSARNTTGTVNRAAGDNFYRFTLSAARNVRFELGELSANADLHLENEYGQILTRSMRPGTAADSVVRGLGPSTWYVRINAAASGAINYRLRYETGVGNTVRWAAYDLGNLTSPASTGGRADIVSRAVTGHRFYTFTLTETRALRFQLRDLSADANLYLENETGQVLKSSVRSGTATDSVVHELGAGAWYIRVSAFVDGDIEFQLRHQTVVPGTVRWAPHELGELTSTASTGTAGATVSRADTGHRFYTFALTEMRTLRFLLRDLTDDANLYLENETGQVLKSSVRPGTATDSVVHELGAGTWYIRVSAFADGDIEYQLHHQTVVPGTVRWAPHELGDLTSTASTGTAGATVSWADTGHRYYRFALTETRTLRFLLRDLSADADLYLENGTGQVLKSSVRSGTTTDSVVHELGAGTWYIRVSAFVDGEIEYQLHHQTVVPGTIRWMPHELGDLTGQASAGTSTGTVNRTGNDNDFFRFTLGTARTMRFELRNLSADADLHLLNASGVEIVSSRRDGTATDSIVRELGPGTYFVRVDADAAGTIEYQLRYHNESGPPAQGTTRETAFAIGDLTGAAAYRIKSGTVNREERNRIYRSFTLTHWRTMRFELRGLSADANLYLEDANGRVLQSSRRSGTSGDTIVRELAPGTWFIGVDANAPGTIRYELRYRREPTPPRGSTHQTAWYIGDLTDATEQRTKSGSVHRRFNDDDYRRFRLAETRTMRFELQGLTGDANLYLEDETGRVLRGSSASGTSQETIVRKLAPGTWYVRVDAEDEGTIRYRLRYAVESESGDGAGAAASLAAVSYGPWRYDGAMANGNPWRNERDRLDGGGTLLAA